MIIGIDLGTTNSLAAVWRDGKAELIPNALGDVLTPSVVGLSDDDQVLIGRAAQERLVTHPYMTVGAFKRYMGTDRTTTLGHREFRPEELSALILRSLKADAEHYLGEPVTEAVVSVPAYFNDTQRKATRVAGELAGLRVERLINEPTAAALAYGLHQRDAESRFLVFDLGGGTFDVSILELFEGIMEVHASAGDNFLGGEDFVDALISAFLAHHDLTASALPPGALNSLRAQAERAKRALNQAPDAPLSMRHGDRVLDWTVSQQQYGQLIQPILDRLRLPVERALRDARLRADDIDEVVLVGGSTRKSHVQKLVSRMFGRLPLRLLNPDEVVAIGAAVQAGLKSRDAALQEVVLTDVCPYSLGIETSTNEGDAQLRGLFEPILERNVVIPASRVKTFYPLQDYQRQVDLRIYQGESRFVRDNILLGSIEVQLPRRKREETGVEVRFTYDINGLLEVEAAVLATGQKQTLVIEQNAGALSPAEIEERLAALAALKVHPREDLNNQALLNRAKRLYEELLGDQRNYVGELITRFSAILEGQDPQRIQRARKELAELLDQFDVSPQQ